MLLSHARPHLFVNVRAIFVQQFRVSVFPSTTLRYYV